MFSVQIFLFMVPTFIDSTESYQYLSTENWVEFIDDCYFISLSTYMNHKSKLTDKTFWTYPEPLL
jgi:hypothetical protein